MKTADISHTKAEVHTVLCSLPTFLICTFRRRPTCVGGSQSTFSSTISCPLKTSWSRLTKCSLLLVGLILKKAVLSQPSSPFPIYFSFTQHILINYTILSYWSFFTDTLCVYTYIRTQNIECTIPLIVSVFSIVEFNLIPSAFQLTFCCVMRALESRVYRIATECDRKWRRWMSFQTAAGSLVARKASSHYRTGRLCPT